MLIPNQANIEVNMFNEFSQVFQDELNPGERLLWSGQPQRGVFFRTSDIFMIPFSLFWGGFAIFWMVMALTEGAPIFFTLFGLPFVLVGLYLIIFRFFFDSWSRSKTFYAVTDQRVILLSGVFNRGVTSISLRNLGEIHLEVRNDGRGTITFGQDSPFSSWGNMSGMGFSRRYYRATCFERIENVRQVYQLIQRAQMNLDPSK